MTNQDKQTLYQIAAYGKKGFMVERITGYAIPFNKSQERETNLQSAIDWYEGNPELRKEPDQLAMFPPASVKLYNEK